MKSLEPSNKKDSTNSLMKAQIHKCTSTLWTTRTVVSHITLLAMRQTTNLNELKWSEVVKRRHKNKSTTKNSQYRSCGSKQWRLRSYNSLTTFWLFKIQLDSWTSWSLTSGLLAIRWAFHECLPIAFTDNDWWMSFLRTTSHSSTKTFWVSWQL